MTRHDWFDVLAGRYITNAAMDRGVAHLVPLDDEGRIDWSAKTLCRKLPAERMSDMPASASSPRCPVCLTRSTATPKRSPAKRTPNKRTKKKRHATRRLRRLRAAVHMRGWGVMRKPPKFKVGDSVLLRRDPTHNWHVREVVKSPGQFRYRIYGIYDVLIVPESALTKHPRR